MNPRPLSSNVRLLASCFSGLLGLLGSSLPLRATFTDVSASSGLNDVSAPQVESPFPAGIDAGTSGYATCAVDLDGDGWTDLILAQNPNRCLVFINNRDGTFREEGVARGLGNAVDIGGIAAGDLSNRGVQDLFMAPRNGDRYLLFVNDGSGHFTEKAAERGVDSVVTGQTHRGQSVALVDYDRDGFLDIHVAELGIKSSPNDPKYCVLFHNLGKASPGVFENVTVASGLKQPHYSSTAQGYSSAWADFDQDGYPDLYLTSDYGTSQLWWNNGNGTFTEGRLAAKVGTEGNGMGVAIADVNQDGRLDIFVSSFDSVSGGLRAANRLYINEGGRKFHDAAYDMHVTDSSWGWGAAFLDADNDGHSDLIVTNGYGFYASYQQSAGDGAILNANIDRTSFFLNGLVTFNELGLAWGITDTWIGRSVAVLDFNNDGFEDVLISNSYKKWILYKDQPTGNSNHWLRLKFQGTTSNRDGYGALVTVKAGSLTQTNLYMPTNAYIGQREPVLHFGLGSHASVDSVRVEWPSGAVQTFTPAGVDRILTVVEPVENLNVAPTITLSPIGGRFEYGSDVQLSAAATGTPTPSWTWYKDGVAIPGTHGATLMLRSLHPYNIGNYTAVANNLAGQATTLAAQIDLYAVLDNHSVARWWDEEILEAIRRDTPNPPVHARNLYHFSAALWDAFWAYEPGAWSGVSALYVKEEPYLPASETDRAAAQREAMSHAAFRILSTRYARSPGAAKTLANIRWLMQQYGFNPDDTDTTGSSPASVGNRIGAAVLAATLHDGANEEDRYADATGYKAVNAPLVPSLPGTVMVDPNRWQPLSLTYSITQNGIVQAGGPQAFVGVNARLTASFALAKPTAETIALDPGPAPQLGGDRHDRVVDDVVDVLWKSSYMDPAGALPIDISPGTTLNNSLGGNNGTGHPVNPVTGQPYAANVVNRADYARVLAEFWADGPNSETPPGHWNVLFNEVSDHPLTFHRYGGVGYELPRLEWDVRGYLALNGSLHDAACAAWTLKRQYDGVRPISLIRYMASLGQSSDAGAPHFNANGLPLVPGLIEQTTVESLAPGQRHSGIVKRDSVVADLVGKIVIRTWKGVPLDPASQVGGVDWILADQWVPYQRDTFVTPAFPGYISGHSTFSRTAAEVLTLLTGSPFFPGGVASRTFLKDHFLEFEKGPSTDLTLQWATYYDAADQAGVSRLFGGIHASIDDVTGRRLGSRIGLEGFLKAHGLRHGGDTAGQLVNISARGLSGSGDRALILGFVVEGTATQDVLVRAIGPTLEAFGIGRNQCAPDPNLTLFSMNDNTRALATNDQWEIGGLGSAVLELSGRLGAFALPEGSLDAASVLRLQAGGFTMVTRPGSDNADKIELVESYGHQLLNGSARGYVGTDANVLIAGFSISGSEPAAILLRGTGPTLASFGVKETLVDPEITVYRLPGGNLPNEWVAHNDNWRDDPKSSLVESASGRVGAFQLNSDNEACLFLQLPPGNYTVTLSGAGGTTGVGLVEFYHVK